MVAAALWASACRTLEQPPGADEIRLSNGTVEVVIGPSRARILHYSFTGDRNLLWTLPDAPKFAGGISNWNNWGGDKAWIWPQADWQTHFGVKWPPPPEMDRSMARTVDPLRHVQLISPVLLPYGVRIVRDIHLAESGTELTVRTRLVPEPGTASVQIPPFAAWTNTQVPGRNDGLFARRLTDDSVWQRLGKNPSLPPPTPIPGTAWLQVNGNPEKWTKSGFEGDAFAMRQGDLLFTQRVLPFTGNAPFAPGVRAQICASPERSSVFPPEIGPYVELEFTAPVASRADLGQYELTVLWQLERLPADADPARVAALLNSVEAQP